MLSYVTKKGNRWYAVIYDGVNRATGKEKYTRVGVLLQGPLVC